MKVQLVIEGEPMNGTVRVSGPIDDLRLVYWLLGEAKRLCEYRADHRQKEQESGIVLAKVIPGPQ